MAASLVSVPCGSLMRFSPDWESTNGHYYRGSWQCVYGFKLD